MSECHVSRAARRRRRAAGVLAAGMAVGLLAACGPEDAAAGGGGTGGSSAGKSSGGVSGGGSPGAGKSSGGTSGGSGGKEPGSGSPAVPGGSGGSGGSSGSSGSGGTSPGGTGTPLTCEKLRNSSVQSDSLNLPDAVVDGAVSLNNGRWEGGGVVIELQPQCDIGDMTGDPAADAVGAIKISTGGTGRFYTLVTWRNDGGTPVPAAAVSLGDRTPVASIDIPEEGGLRQATVMYRTRGDDDPPAVLNLTRTAVYRVSGARMVELHHSDAPYTP